MQKLPSAGACPSSYRLSFFDFAYRRLYFLDRLLMAAVVESRGHSRFRLLANAITLGDALQAFYARIADSEARHTNVFVDLAARYFEATIVQERLAEWRVIEAEVIRLLPARACLH